MASQAASEPSLTRRPSPPALSFVAPADFRRAARGVAGKTPHAVFVVHVERSHEVSVRCGHRARDALLERVTGRLAEDGGPWLSACRLGDARFALLKSECGLADALALARRLHDALDGSEFRWHHLAFRLGATVAVIEMEKHAHTLDDLLDRAANACNVACSLGSDGVVVLTGRAGEQEDLEREREWREHVNEVLG